MAAKLRLILFRIMYGKIDFKSYIIGNTQRVSFPLSMVLIIGLGNARYGVD